jgi:glutathione S-transferase
MADELVLYSNPMSRGRVVRWMLEEIGEPYKVEVLDYASTMKGPDYLAINPMGKVPALRHGDAVVTETAAICAYLADAFPRAQLAPPPGDRLRAPYYRWLFFTAGPFEAAASNKVLGFVVPPERERMMGYGNFGKTISTLEAAVSSADYLVGNRYRRSLSRRANRLRHDVWDPGATPRVRTLLAAVEHAAALYARDKA